MQQTFTVKIGAHCQATIPQGLLDLFHLRPGDEVEITASPTGLLRAIPQRHSLFSRDVIALLEEREARIDAGEYHEGMEEFPGRRHDEGRANAAKP